MNGASTGSFYAFAIQQTDPANEPCSATITLYKTVNGSVSAVASTTLGCQKEYVGMVAPDGSLRLAAALNVPGPSPNYYVPLAWKDTGTPLTGAAGFGAAGPGDGSNLCTYEADISPIDRIAPSTISAATVKTFVMPTEIDIQTGGSVDDANGVGLYEYQWYRDGQYMAATWTPEFSDATVAAGSQHTYGISAVDFDGNAAPITSFTVTTPATAAVDPRRVGVRSTGSYWGGMGEQIDVRSGNLNYAYPLITVVSRGLSLPLGLAYNSQNWRLDSNNTSWNLGFDSGYGFGWLLEAGSITPFYSSTWNVAYYLFRDATGASYRLDQNNNGIWTSKETVYVSFDDTQQILYFNDGSNWRFDILSAGLEADAGTYYPSSIQDSNGNLLVLEYEPGNATGDVENSSARLEDIYDARSPDSSTSGTHPTYTFSYDSTRHLTNLTNGVGSGESFTFSYSSPATLTSPFSSSSQFGSMETLSSVTNNTTGLVTSFSYDPANSGELNQVTLPYGGHLRWQYGNTAYASVTLRTVANRYLLWDNSIGERPFSLAMTLGNGSLRAANTTVVDSQAQAGKNWAFDTSSDATQGLVTIYQEYRTTDGTILHQMNYSWTQDATGKSYISRIQDIADPGQSYAATKQTDQTIDPYGNVTQTKLYAFGNLSTPARTYTNTYLSDPNYTSLYIFNRLLSSTVSDNNGNTLTLVTNTYDQSPLAGAPGANWLTSDTTDVYRGNVTSSVSFGHTVNKQYDITGAVVYTDDGNANHGLTITNGSSTQYAAPSAITTANSLTTSFSWNQFLAPLSSTGPNGDASSATYDSATGRPASSTSPYGAVTTYAYSSTGPQVTATTNGHWTQTYFDGLGRTARVAEGNGSTTVSYTDTVYDTCGCTPVGKPYKTSLPYAPGNTPAWKAKTYDAIGRTLTSVAPDGASTTTYSYAGNTVTVTDPTGKWKQYVTDAFGQLVQVIEQSPNPGTEPNHVTNYSYDLLGHLIQAQMPRTINGQVVTQTRTWTYDSNTQLLIQTVTPEAGATQYTYNTDGTLATKTDAKSQQIQYTYDPYGRLIQIARGKLVNGQFTEDTTQRTAMTYDGTNGGFSSNTAGRVSQVNYSGPHGLNFTELYSYHAAGAIIAKRMSVAGTALGANVANLDANYGYDSLGNVTSVQYPFAQWSNGAVVTAGPQYGYSYDVMNRIGGITGPGGQTLVNSVTYGPANQMLQLNASSFTETRTYNANLQLTELVSGSNLHLKYNYSATQNNGRITSMQDVVSGETVVYAYDTLNRLITANGTGDPSGAWSQAFQFDGFGNLTQKTGSNAPNNAFLSTDPTTNRLNSGGAGYDSNGNLTAYGTGSFAAAYSYDIENRLFTATPVPGGNTIWYGYDSANQRVYQGIYNVSTATYSNEQLYFYGADGKKLGCWSISVSGGNVTLTATTTNIWFAGRLLTPGDRLQSRGKYFPFGEDRYSPNPANPTNDQEKFATYTRDSATLLDYAYQRYYNSQLGRFQSVDPDDGSANPNAPQSWNRYGYVLGDPANEVDVTGEGEYPYFCTIYSWTWECSPYPVLGRPFNVPKPQQPLVPEGINPHQAALLRAKRWNSLSADCKKGLQTAMPVASALENTDYTITQRLAALDAAQAAQSNIQSAVGNTVPWDWVAAIGIEETGFGTSPRTGGNIFQLGPGHATAAQAGNLSIAAGIAGAYLRQSLDQLSGYRGLSNQALETAAFDAYNAGVTGVKNALARGGTADSASANGHYGTTALQLSDCFK